MVENVEEWWSADQSTTEMKKMMKAKEERDVRAASSSLGALRGESRARVAARAGTSQPRERTEEAIAAAQARGAKISPAKSNIFSPLQFLEAFNLEGGFNISQFTKLDKQKIQYRQAFIISKLRCSIQANMPSGF